MSDPKALDTLERRHRDEAKAEAARMPFDHPRPLNWRLPPDGHFEQSQAWLDRLYAGDRVPREKKPMVLDHLRCFGPWMVSVDEPPASVLDGMSQTATVAGGFSPDPVVRAYVEGDLSDGVLRSVDPAFDAHPAAQAFADLLRAQVPGLPTVSFAASGAEANEKPLSPCHAQARPEQRRVLAFEGGFHGRTLLALHATANPKKRGPYELAGYEARFAPFPAWSAPTWPGPEADDALLEAAAHGGLRALAEAHPVDPEQTWAEGGEPLLGLELRALVAVEEILEAGEVFACIVEPMQAEGGDRYATPRFFQTLRVLTRAYGVPLVFDEVQTGLGLGGPFAWHRSFHLRTPEGAPDGPDAVTFAKRAQLGVCLSRFEDPDPGSAQLASVARGLVHAQMVLDPAYAERAREVEAVARERLSALADRFPELVTHPRGRGFALAFDLPSPEHLSRYLAQRFWRGVVVFGAGQRTVRYRLTPAFGADDLERLFEAVEGSLAWLAEHPGEAPPAWQETLAPPPPAPRSPAVRRVGPEEADEVVQRMVALEAEIYEPARREDPEVLRAQVGLADAVLVVAEETPGDLSTLLGFALGVPLESVGDRPGPDRDPMLGKENTLYSVSITVAARAQGRGIGAALKRAQLAEAARLRHPDGRPRYTFCTGRNRVGHTGAMTRLNRRFGACALFVLEGQYGETEGRALYYRQPVRPVPLPTSERSGDGVGLDPAGELAMGVQRPLVRPPKSLRAEAEAGLLMGPVVDKITLCNYVTPAIVRAVEWVSALIPDLPHLYLTSGRDEVFDKALRVCRTHRPEAQVVLRLSGSYFGHVSAAARSASDPGLLTPGLRPFFEWPAVPHPATTTPEAFEGALCAAVE
ncbi:MAG: aminotransferase class III-fold pyridoxal phosphate-dependent enzyme, partial [Deltaproteobacteria bacterium]